MKKLLLFICTLTLCTAAFSEDKTIGQRAALVAETAATAGAAAAVTGKVAGPAAAGTAAAVGAAVTGTHAVIATLDHAAEAAVKRHFERQHQEIVDNIIDPTPSITRHRGQDPANGSLCSDSTGCGVQ